jgi:hypothetical protein
MPASFSAMLCTRWKACSRTPPFASSSSLERASVCNEWRAERRKTNKTRRTHSAMDFCLRCS